VVGEVRRDGPADDRLLEAAQHRFFRHGNSNRRRG
jgi:hypothetical protein